MTGRKQRENELEGTRRTVTARMDSYLPRITSALGQMIIDAGWSECCFCWQVIGWSDSDHSADIDLYWQTQLGNLPDQLDLSWVQNICWIFSKKEKKSAVSIYAIDILSPTIHKIRNAVFDCFPNRMINSRDRVQSCDDLDRSAAHGWLRCIGEGWHAKQYRPKDVWPSIMLVMWIGGRQHRGRRGQPGGEDQGGRWR